MVQLIALIISGCVAGAIYSLLGVGLVVSYSTSRIFNFGQAAVAFATAYVYFQLRTGFGWSMPPALIVSVLVFAPAAGYLWDRLVFRNLGNADESAKIVCGIGVLLVMPALVVWLSDVFRVDFHWNYQDASQVFAVAGIGPTPPAQYHVFSGLILSSDQLIALGVGVTACIACWALLRLTRIGLEMRSAVDAPTLAGLRGINTRRISSMAWILSFTLAGLAGVLAAPIVGAFGLNSDNYTFALFVAIAAAVIARMTSVPIAFLAGLVIGALRNLALGYLTPHYIGGVGTWIQNVSGLSGSLPYILLLIALIVRGKEGTLTKIAGTTALIEQPPQYLTGIAPFRRRLPWIIAFVVVMAYALGPANVIWRDIVISGFATGIIFLSITVMTGMGGLISFAQASLACFAAMLVGYFASLGWPFLPSVIVACLICIAAGVVIALPGLKLGPLAVAFTTLTLALIISSVVLESDALNNQSQGWTLVPPKLWGLNFANERIYLILVVLVFGAAVFLVTGLMKSSVGRAMTAVKTAEPAAVSSGISPTTIRLLLFAVSTALAAIGGILLVEVGGSVNTTTFTPTLGFVWLAAVVVFGANRIAGAIVAAFAATAMPYIIEQGVHIGSIGWNGAGLGGYTSTLLPTILFGFAAVGLSKHPFGILSQMAERRYLRRLQRAKRRQARASDIVLAAEPAFTTPMASPTLDPIAASNGLEPSILRLENVSAGYGPVEVLHSVSLSVTEGSALAIVGANGAGKSTMAGVIGGTVPNRGGHIFFDGHDISTSESRTRADMGIVLVPESRGVFPGLTVEENLRIWLNDSGGFDEIYERFINLGTRRRVVAGNLSGGEQQMLSLAPFFVRKPKLLIVDEPTMGLAPAVAAVVLDALSDLRQEGVTLLLVEEKASEVFRVADHVGAMTRGRLIWIRPTSEVGEAEVEAAYLGAEAVR